MNNKCYKTRDRIADLITGILPQTQLPELQHHLNDCPDCRDYRRALQTEDELLAALSAKFKADMPARRQLVLDAVNNADLPPLSKMLFVCRLIVESWVTRSAALAALIAFLVVYSIMTLTCLSQINECIQICS